MAGIYKGWYPAASSPGIDSSLYLNVDQSLRLVYDYLFGRWAAGFRTKLKAALRLADPKGFRQRYALHSLIERLKQLFPEAVTG